MAPTSTFCLIPPFGVAAVVPDPAAATI